jgi:uncharacterized protein (TIGR00288 family)
MISKPAPRAPYQAAPNFQQHHAPNAALLIDFDNVTMGIRSDLGKELKSLLNSEVIRGKVAVQRAYADWRRYPQYIVPLAESSIDLIFAPAYGSAKKNATDLRMAIDAIELVFTRPEIGTFILMTGDSDFSSCVLKLKEYGKYVIGVGMRESSSDLLIQNCDEYYSYHSLSGLTRAGEVVESKEDPWVLVKRAAQQMVANNDVMRTDRLKQVMLELDPSFDEKKIGYSKFSRFVQDAGTKGLIHLRKGENGQYEIVGGSDEAPRAAESAPREEGRPSRGRGRGRGRDEGRREPRELIPRAESEPSRAPEPVEAAEPDAESMEPVARPEPTPEPVAEAPERSERPARTERPERSERPARPAAEPSLVEDATLLPPPPSTPELQEAYALLQEAVRTLTGGPGKAVRDGDVKRKMLAFSPGFDETALGFSKFTRFLREAHDAEVIDLKRVNGGNFEVSLPSSGKRLPSPNLSAAARATEMQPAPPEAPVERAPARPERPPVERAPAPRPEAERAPVERAPERTESRPAAPAPSQPSTPLAPSGMRGRRGGRGPMMDGPPPILPGQVLGGRVSPPVEAPRAPEPAAPAPPAVEAESAAEERSPEGRSRRGRRGRGKGGAEEAAAEPEARTDGRGRGRGKSAGAQEAPVEVAPEEAPAAPAKRGRGRPRSAPAAAAQEAGFSASRLGLPEGREAAIAYITGS